MINLCIIDDDIRLANQIRDELMDYPELNWIKTYDSGLDYLQAMKGMRTDQLPHCILMDISMRMHDEGLQTTRQLQQKHPEIKVVMFTVADNDDQIFEAFKSGAVGYLLKNERPSFIVKAVVEVVNGGALISPGIAMKAIKFLSGMYDKKPERSNDSRLTERELEILKLISKGFKYQQVADQLFISLQTVKKHISNIFEKLHVNNKIEALNKSKGLF